jgi:hypothetical protein
MTRVFRGMVIIVAAVLGTSLHAQERWTIEARGGGAVPTAKLIGTVLSTGVAITCRASVHQTQQELSA